MHQVIISILLTVLMSMVGTKLSAKTISNANFSASNSDGVMIYYCYINNGEELAVVNCWDGYSGDLVIPEEVTYMNRTRKVTSLGSDVFMYDNITSVTLPNSINTIPKGAFYQCKELKSINIPSGVTTIGEQAFYQCGLTSITLPEDLEIIEDYAFAYCKFTSITLPKKLQKIGGNVFYQTNLEKVVSLIENPSQIHGVTLRGRTFDENTFYNATLYVPVGTIDKYKATEGWKDFIFIEEGTGPNGGDTPLKDKCATPTVGYQNGKLMFNCDTEGAICQYSITDDDIKSGSSNEVQLGVTYNISVYATKFGYENSETATATLCWIEVEPKTEGITNIVSNVRARAVLIQSNGNQLTISGAEEGTAINVFDISGKQAGSAKATSETTTINTTLRSGDIGIVKIGEKAIKVLMK